MTVKTTGTNEKNKRLKIFIILQVLTLYLYKMSIMTYL